MSCVLWLERPPLLRWLGAGILVAVAAWSELAPPPHSSAYFLVENVAAGTPLGSEHVEARPVPAGTLQTVAPRGMAAVDLVSGDPLVASLMTEVSVPSGWVVIEGPVPSHALPGASATAILVGDGAAPVEFPALVVGRGESDPLSGNSGTLAVPGEWIGPAAAAVTEGRLVIGVAAPDR